MTIGPGTSWSVAGLLPSDAPVFTGDRDLSKLVNHCRRQGLDLPVVGLTGGGLWDTVGGPSVPGRLRTTEARHYPVDVIRAELDDQVHWFIANLLARTPRWRDTLAVMNTPWFRGLRLGHRSHPGDALLDVTEGTDLSFDDLRRIVPRARHGAHLPHPKLRERRVGEASWMFSRPRRVLIDGKSVGSVRCLRVRVEPDALVVVV